LVNTSFWDNLANRKDSDSDDDAQRVCPGTYILLGEGFDEDDDEWDMIIVLTALLTAVTATIS
jgi:hypothetical protein